MTIVLRLIRCHVFRIVYHVFRLGLIVLIIGAGWVISSAGAVESTSSSNAQFEPGFPESNQDIVSDVISSSIRQPSDKAKLKPHSNQTVDSNENESEVYTLPQIPLFSESDLLAFNLPAMPQVKRPSSSAHFLTKAEQRFCFFYQSSLVEDARLINRQCLGTEQLYNANLGLDKYIFVLKALALFRAKFELGLTESEVDKVLNITTIKQQAQQQLEMFKKAKRPSQGKELTQEQDLNCFLLRSMSIGMRELINVGYSLEKANEIVALFNTQCAGRLSHGERLLAQLETLNIPELIQPITDGAIYSVTDYLKPKSYLFPFAGTPEQRYVETLEAQQHLTTLGYLQAPLSGILDEFTFVAMSDFENDQGLIQTGQVSFSNLMRLRLYTIGYKPEFLIPQLASAQVSLDTTKDKK